MLRVFLSHPMRSLAASDEGFVSEVHGRDWALSSNSIKYEI